MYPCVRRGCARETVASKQTGSNLAIGASGAESIHCQGHRTARCEGDRLQYYVQVGAWWFISLLLTPRCFGC